MIPRARFPDDDNAAVLQRYASTTVQAYCKRVPTIRREMRRDAATPRRSLRRSPVMIMRARICSDVTSYAKTPGRNRGIGNMPGIARYSKKNEKYDRRDHDGTL